MTAHVENALIYYLALKDAGILAELHIDSPGGHGFGLRPTDSPISRRSQQAETWLHSIKMLGPITDSCRHWVTMISPVWMAKNAASVLSLT